MYEIWLTLNILFELSLQYLPAVIGSLTLWLVLMTIAAARGAVLVRQHGLRGRLGQPRPLCRSVRRSGRCARMADRCHETANLSHPS